ncbi:16S rRNA (uracil(1498)-N(3))-methyltransferase [Halomonas elongata]|uniref:16S rRNA (uracil(1498)-N(3))-methyltransferase n=1 Tax=Halomonas elongata TaxID=2746 RepID=UPI00186B9BD6|nr:16S rRNA (uracil(1498)-N(3))-methyltransferase [Halomonas elongata]MBW5799527.1 16S rRNA (uracil(1498)-N(3))-methyltransferase [Halomonas elongata]MDL4863957.1 16S rRNA (uracil(1498)-N(3))-methyltransferase [Halomonas elongata]
MNLILLSPEDLENGRLARVRDPRRLAHLRDVHRARAGDTLTLGVENGLLGRGTLLEYRDDEALFDISGLVETPPPALPVHLVLALPRPRMLARSLEHATALGVKALTLLNTRRVEKSYWQSPELGAEKIRRHLVLGLEQARDTQMPEVTLAKGFRPFVEDRLPKLLASSRGLVAHPGMPEACPRGVDEPVTLVIGPEGGFIPWEVDKLLEAGCRGIHLGPRILRVETAVTALLARLA